MMHIDVLTGTSWSGTDASCAPAVVHVVDIDADVHRVLTGWLAAAAIESRAYAHVGAFLNAHRADLPGCLVIDAQPPAIGGLELQAMLLPLAIRYPIVMTIPHAAVGIPIGSMKEGAVNLVEKPLREREIVAAVRAAIEFDRRQRLIASCRAELRVRFATLSWRERQVMALVTTGMLNKQVAIDLGISEITVKCYRGAAMRKMGARSLADLVRMADAIGICAALARNVRSAPARNAVAGDRRSGCTQAPAESSSFRAAALGQAR